MGLWDSIKDVGGLVAAPLTGGMSLVGMSEDTRSKIPLLGGLTGAQSDAEKALIKKQQQMAEDAKKQKAMNEQARMNALAQQMLAFNPRNQVMAQMFGPEAAFNPQQMAQMAQNPQGPYQGTWGQGTDAERIQQVKSRDAEQRRQQMLAANMQPLPQGPAPLQQRAPQPGRRY
jgi:hypothetical protein